MKIRSIIKQTFLIIFLMTAKLTFGQINGGFEVWDTTYVGVYSSDLNNIFGVPNPYTGVVNHWISQDDLGISQTTDSYSGNYSLILHNWYNYVYEKISYSDTISFRPQYLQGYFKYITGGDNELAQGTATVTLTYFNGISNDTIAKGTYLFDSTNYFTPFQIVLNYSSSLTPDSIKIFIINSDKSCTGQNMICNLLYLDNLALTTTPLGIDNLISTENVATVYPNPTHNKLTIQNNLTQSIKFTLYNSLGQKIISKLLTTKTSTINLSDYPSGIYFYKLISDNNTIKNGKIIKQ